MQYCLARNLHEAKKSRNVRVIFFIGSQQRRAAMKLSRRQLLEIGIPALLVLLWGLFGLWLSLT